MMPQFIVYYTYRRPDNRGGGERKIRAENEHAAIEAFLVEFKKTSWATPFHPEWFEASATPAVGDFTRSQVLKALRTLHDEELAELFKEAANMKEPGDE